MDVTELKFFKHEIDGKLYGAWYRLVSLLEVEVQTIGFLHRVSWDGVNPEAAARYCLEDHVRARSASGRPIPSVQDVPGGRIADGPSGSATANDDGAADL